MLALVERFRRAPRVCLALTVLAASGCSGTIVVADAAIPDSSAPLDGSDDARKFTAADCPGKPPLPFDSCSQYTLHCTWGAFVCDCDAFGTWECSDTAADLNMPDLADNDLGHCAGGLPVCGNSLMDHTACTTVGDRCGLFAHCDDQCACVGPEKKWQCCGRLTGNVCDPSMPVKDGDLCCPNAYTGGCTFHCPGPSGVHCDCINSHFACRPDPCTAPVDAGRD